MGIPSYFRRIIQKFPRILKGKSSRAGALCFDFNCLIYRCIRAPGMSAAPEAWEEEKMESWEGELLKEVCRTVLEVWKVAERPKRVLLAVDGVVPMAKIRQQRVRRFKSAWLRRNGGHGGWDTNAITPGTAFMDRLTIVLEKLAKDHGSSFGFWEVSGVREHGEGEHKIMRWLREHASELQGESVVVYGLDADLILLSMLTSLQTGIPISLLREKQEFGGAAGADAAAASAEQEYQCMNLTEFKDCLGIRDMRDIVNYIGMMSLMGNDFLPHSLTHKLNDDGHEFVLKEFSRHAGLFEELDGKWKLNIGVFLEIARGWSVDEDERMLHMITKKQEQARRGILKGMDASEGLPLEWAVEKEMLEGENSERLKKGWREVYWSWLGADVGEMCKKYIQGCQWVIDYYTGQNEIDLNWTFPCWIPPLWSDFARATYQSEEDLQGQKDMQAIPTPEEQLAMVLPLESWGLIRNRKHRTLPNILPHMWPESFTFFSLGRKWLWECEARIPVLTAARLRQNLKEEV